jgi:hypothetical protein
MSIDWIMFRGCLDWAIAVPYCTLAYSNDFPYLPRFYISIYLINTAFLWIKYSLRRIVFAHRRCFYMLRGRCLGPVAIRALTATIIKYRMRHRPRLRCCRAFCPCGGQKAARALAASLHRCTIAPEIEPSFRSRGGARSRQHTTPKSYPTPRSSGAFLGGG